MGKKTAFGLIAVIVIAFAVISVGCIGEKGESERKVKGAPLSVKIEKVVYPEAIFGKELDVSINITNSSSHGSFFVF